MNSSMERKKVKIIVSGGGTGGHIFPAISIANALKESNPEVEILFVGAEGKMEMEKVPAAGYKIVGLPVVGFKRKLSLQNIGFFFKLFKSIKEAKRIFNDFKPDVVVGVGGYASGPMLKVAQKNGVPTLIQEQNSYAGVTNKLLAKKAHKICVAYHGMEKYFPKEKIMLTGNPVRQDLTDVAELRERAFEYFGIPTNNKVLLVLGGSLGARTLNQSLLAYMTELAVNQGVTVIWQTGKLYYFDVKQELSGYNAKNIRILDFVTRMDLAYAAADLVISRAGAGTISELCLVGKPAILVPSPNVAEDHQTQNAIALVSSDAAVMVRDVEAQAKLIPTAIGLLQNNDRLVVLARNIKKMALPNSAQIIAKEVMKLVKR